MLLTQVREVVLTEQPNLKVSESLSNIYIPLGLIISSVLFNICSSDLDEYKDCSLPKLAKSTLDWTVMIHKYLGILFALCCCILTTLERIMNTNFDPVGKKGKGGTLN